MLFGQMAGWGIILSPVMLLIINLLGDGIPGINLAKEPSDPTVMNLPPARRDEGFFTATMMRNILRQTLSCSLVVLTGFYIGAFLEIPGFAIASPVVGQTMAFLICGWTSILHIFNVRSEESVFRTPINNNKPLLACVVAMIAALGLMVVSPLGSFFGLTRLSAIHWLAVIVLSLVPTLTREVSRVVDNLPHRREHLGRMKARRESHRATMRQRLQGT